MASNGKNTVLGSNREWSQVAFDALSEFNAKVTQLRQQHTDHEGPNSHVNYNVMEKLDRMQVNAREALGMLNHLAPKAEQAAPEETPVEGE